MRAYSPSLRASWLINRTSLVKEGFVLWPKDFAGRERTISMGHFGHSGIKPIQRQDCLPLEAATYFWSTVKLSIDGKITGMESAVHELCHSCIECPWEKKSQSVWQLCKGEKRRKHLFFTTLLRWFALRRKLEEKFISYSNHKPFNTHKALTFILQL